MSGVFSVPSLWPFVEAIVEHLENLPSTAAADMIYALGVCGVRDELILEALTVRLEQRDIGPIGAKTASLGLRCLGIEPQPWLARLASDARYELRSQRYLEVDGRNHSSLDKVCSAVIKEEYSDISEAIEALDDADIVVARRLLCALPDRTYTEEASRRIRQAQRDRCADIPVRSQVVRTAHLTHPNDRFRVRAMTECILAGDIYPKLRSLLS